MTANIEQFPTEVLVSRELTVENTTYCGAACHMCPREDYSRRWSHMTMELFQRSVHEGARNGMESLDLCGFGDPLMDKGFEDKLEWAKETYPAIKIYTATTGHLLHKSRLERLARCLDTLKFSHYGFSKESYEAVHQGVVKYKRTRDNILRMLDRPRSERPYVIMSFLILPENEHETDAWREFWEPRADEVTIWKPHNYGGGRDFGHYEKAERELQKPETCGRPFYGNPFVRTNGEVSMCCFDYDNRLIIGDIAKESLAEIMSGARIAYIRSVHRNKEFKGCGLLCEGCDQIYDRNDALVYSNNKNRRVGVTTTHPDLVNDMLQESR